MGYNSTGDPFGSRPVGRDNDDSRVFRQLHCGVERTHQAVLHDTRYGHGAAVPTEVGLDGRRGRVGWQVKGCLLWLGGDLLVSCPTTWAPLVNFGYSHCFFLSVCRDYEDRHFAQLAEDIGDLVVLSIVPPDHPNSAARRRLGEHLEGTVLAFLKAVCNNRTYFTSRHPD